jgi:hypothetical protein
MKTYDVQHNLRNDFRFGDIIKALKPCRLIAFSSPSLPDCQGTKAESAMPSPRTQPPKLRVQKFGTTFCPPPAATITTLTSRNHGCRQE